MVCQFCMVCDKENCPKEGKGKTADIAYIAVSKCVEERIKQICEDNNFLKGESYYQVPDYNRAVEFLLRTGDQKLGIDKE